MRDTLVEITNSEEFSKSVQKALGIYVTQLQSNPSEYGLQEGFKNGAAEKILCGEIYITTRTLGKWKSKEQMLGTGLKKKNLYHFIVTLIKLEAGWKSSSHTRIQWLSELLNSTSYKAGSFDVAGVRSILKDLQSSFGKIDEKVINEIIDLLLQGQIEYTYLEIAWKCFFDGDYQNASNEVGKSLEIATNTDNLQLKAKCLELSALIHSFTDVAPAYKQIKLALHIYESLGNVSGIASASRVLGIYYESCNNFEQAETHYKKAYELIKNLGSNSELLCNIYGHLGNVEVYKGNFEAAKNYYIEGIAIAEKLQNIRLQGVQTGNMGNVLEDLGEYHEANFYFGKALTLSQLIGDRYNEGIHYGNIGHMNNMIAQKEQKQDHFFKALEYYQKAFEVATEIRDLLGVCFALTNQAEVYSLLRECDKAHKLYNQAESQNQHLSNSKVTEEITTGRARLAELC